MSVSKNIRVLVIDDIERIRHVIINSLRQLGFFNIEQAIDGVDGLRILKKQRVDLIISDWDMPEMDGLELLKTVRRIEALKHIPFLMVTAETHRDNIVKAIDAGVNNYIVKPFESKTLAKKINIVFKKSTTVPVFS